MADIPPSDKLTTRQQKAIGCLLAEPTIRKAAEAANVPERTLYAWLNDGNFATAYREARRDTVIHAAGRLQQYSSAAANVLLSIMAKETTPAHIRMNAASKVLDLASIRKEKQ
jgi:hypothetical protein